MSMGLNLGMGQILQPRLLQLQLHISFSKFAGLNYKQLEEAIVYALANPDLAGDDLKSLERESDDDKRGWHNYIDDELKEHLEQFKGKGYNPDYLLEETEGSFRTELNPKIGENLESITSRFENDERYGDKDWKYWNNLIKVLIKEYDWILGKSSEIADFAVDFQKKYLRSEDDYDLEKLTMVDLGERIGLSTSSISRLVNCKTLQLLSTEIVTLKSIIPGYSIDRRRISSLLKKIMIENPGLNDAKLNELLLEDYGVNIARRTLNKYRNELGYHSGRVDGYDLRTAAQVYGKDVFNIAENLKTGRLKFRNDGKISVVSLDALYGGRKNEI